MQHFLLRLIAAGTLVLPGISLAAEADVYEAVVLDQGAEVRAGPGRRFYVTQELAPGARVEVYRRETGDWLAIRPPDGSFSWIPEADLEMTEEPAVAEVTAEKTQSWIGSRAERIREHKSHVTLARGERVEVLGKKQVEGTDGRSQLWLKISPPAGEFRWVHSRQVRRATSRELARAKDEMQPADRAPLSGDPNEPSEPSRNPVQRAIPARGAIVLSDLRDEKADRKVVPVGRRNAADDSSEKLYPVRQAAHEESIPNNREPLSPDGFVPRRRQPAGAPSGGANLPRLAATPVRTNGPPVTAGSSAASRSAGDDVSRELDDLDLQLSLMLSRDRSTWNFSEIKERALRLVDNADSPAQRGEARFMLDKLKQLESAFDITSLPAEAQRSAAATKKEFPSYDGEGWLTAVKSTERPVAPFALVDDDGKRICFVSPVPGLNVSRHVNQRVGLYGKRGLIPDLNMPHVLASKVIDLDHQVR